MGSVPTGPDGLASTWRLSCWPGCTMSPASKMPPRPCPRRGPPYAHNHTEPLISLSSSWYGASLELKKIKIKMSNECQKERSVCLLGDVWGWRCVHTGGGAQQAACWCGQAGDKPRCPQGVRLSACSLLSTVLQGDWEGGPSQYGTMGPSLRPSEPPASSRKR